MNTLNKNLLEYMVKRRGKENDDYIVGYIYGQGQFTEEHFTISIDETVIYNCKYLLNTILSSSRFTVIGLEVKDKCTIITCEEKNMVKDLNEMKLNSVELLSLMNINVIRGYIDSTGILSIVDGNKVVVKVGDPFMKRILSAKKNTVDFTQKDDDYTWISYDAIDWLHSLYDSKFYYNINNYEEYKKFLKIESPMIECKKTLPTALYPVKYKKSLPYINVYFVKKMNETESQEVMYDSGIDMKIPFGYYLDFVNTPNIILNGYCVVEGICIPDQNNIIRPLITLKKTNHLAKELALPFTVRMELKKNFFTVLSFE